MQMSRLYQSTNKKIRAQQLRKDGRELARAGYGDSANQNFELAEILDPTPREATDNVGNTTGRFSIQRRPTGKATQPVLDAKTRHGGVDPRAARAVSRTRRAA